MSRCLMTICTLGLLMSLYCMALSESFSSQENTTTETLHDYFKEILGNLIYKRNQAACSAGTQRNRETCTLGLQKCFHHNHPKCNVTIRSTEVSRFCITTVDCGFNRSDLLEPSNSIVCFATNNAFPTPKYMPPNMSTPNHTFWIWGKDSTGDVIANNNGSGNVVHVTEMVRDFVNQHSSVTWFRVSGGYQCSRFKYCNLATPSSRSAPTENDSN